MKRKYRLSPGERGLLFLLAVALVFWGGWKGYSLFVRLTFQKALDAFDPETTAFHAVVWDCRRRGEKNQSQMTPEQRQVVARYLGSLRFREAYLADPLKDVAGGVTFYIAFETPQGQLFAGFHAHLQAKGGPTYLAGFEHDEALYRQLKQILQTGAGEEQP